MKKPMSAKAIIKGSEKYPGINGCAAFVTTDLGTMVTISVYGLPRKEGKCECSIFAVHIHSGSTCTGDAADPFKNAGSHYDKGDCPHPCHSGDMPSLYAYPSEGSDLSDRTDQAHMAFITNRFTPEDIIGRVIIIHTSPDDMHTQPSGNSGEKIACGEIVSM